MSVITKDFAELLGLDLSGEKDSTFGVSGEARCVHSTMKLRVANEHESYNFEVPVMVITDAFDVDILLGREVFFDEFKITFDQSRRKIVLKKN